MNHIYLDYNATTPLDPLVLERMLPYLKENFGNPSSIHWAGRRAKTALIKARESVARLLNADSSEILFTSSGSESINLAIKGSYFANLNKKHFITTTVEHPATLQSHKWLEEIGCEVTYIEVDKSGALNLEKLKNSIREDSNLISIMYANHETGVIFPIEEVCEIAKQKNVTIHCDGVQTVGKIDINLNVLPVDLFSFSAHKFHGPKGVAALFVREGIRLKSLIHGGGQERKRRGGTEALPQIVGMGVAADILTNSLQEIEGRLRELKLYLESKLEIIPGVMIVGKENRRIPNTTMIIIEGIASESLLLNLDLHGVAVSSGAACSSGKLEPSAVLQAMGFTKEEASSSLRISYGKETAEEELDTFVKVLIEILSRLCAVGDGAKLHNSYAEKRGSDRKIYNFPPSPIDDNLSKAHYV